MMNMKTFAGALVAGVLMFSLPASIAQAAIIDFDDLPGSQVFILDGYGGLNWSNFAYATGAVDRPGTGYEFGTISPRNVAFNANGQPSSLDAGGASFIFNSAYFTAAWNAGVQLQISGFNGLDQIYTTTLTLSRTTPVLFTANWTGLTSLSFNSFIRGVGNNNHFVMDNLTINEGGSAVPEPATWAMMIIGFGAVGSMVRTSRRRNALSLV